MQRFQQKALLKGSFGEVAEWSIAAVLKTVVPRGTRGSNPCLSAIKGVNQAFARFTPFFTPKNVKLGVFVFFKILQKNVNYKAIGISMDWQNERLSGNFWLLSFKISYLCLPLFYETRTTPSCHPSGCAYRQL